MPTPVCCKPSGLTAPVCILIWMICAGNAWSNTHKERNILATEAKAIDLAQSLVRDDSWNTYPRYADREFWQQLSPDIRRDYMAKAEAYLNYDWPTVKATDYLEYIRSGDRRQEVYAACSNALISLVMGELVEGKGRFINQIINAVWYYSEQTWWGWSAHLGAQKAGPGLPDVNDPVVDLGVGEIVNNLSWTLYLFKDAFDQVHPLIAQRLRQEITGKVLTPYFERDDFWYMGFKGGRPNNWNPWVNYNMLNSYLLLESDPVKKLAQVQKIIFSIDKFLNGYSDDGGCDEGPSYWGVAGGLLYESLDLLKRATHGKFDVFDEPLVQNIGKYFYRVNIHAPYFINFADADATTFGNPAVVYLYGKSIGDNVMQEFGAYLAGLSHWGEQVFNGKICDQIRNLRLLNEIGNAKAKEALVADFWFPDTDIAGGRDKEGSYTGFFFGAKGGFNAESHNHNDVGSCVLYFDGKPCLIDLGREKYNARTFGPGRYEIWTMQSQYHNLPVVNGRGQLPGAAYKAKGSVFSATDNKVFFATDISGAYPDSALVKKWIRSYTLNRNKNFVISDHYQFTPQPGAVTSSNLITYCAVVQIGDGMLQLQGEGFTLNMKYNPKVVKPQIERIEVKDMLLKKYWPKGVTRIVMEFLNPKSAGSTQFTFTAAR